MTIAEAMQEQSSLILGYGERWLASNEAGGWVVYERRHRQRHARVAIETSNEHEAVRYLLGREPERR